MRRRLPALDGGILAGEILSLSKLDIDKLRERWKAICGKAPCREIGRSLSYPCYSPRSPGAHLRRPQALYVLSHAVDETATKSAKRPRIRTAQTGTILIREWQGTAHRVTMLDRGVSFKGKLYRSLSEVAREITGSRWSGPRFFGLRSHNTENIHAAK